MSRTTRRHEAAAKTARRGPKNPTPEDPRVKDKKTNKQRRVGDRAKLRKEWT